MPVIRPRPAPWVPQCFPSPASTVLAKKACNQTCHMDLQAVLDSPGAGLLQELDDLMRMHA
eukprot:3963609-Alexandrium_andersonii.AAC.1